MPDWEYLLMKEHIAPQQEAYIPKCRTTTYERYNVFFPTFPFSRTRSVPFEGNVLFSNKKNTPVRKLPDANDRTVIYFENFDAKSFIFSIFLKLSQMLSNDVKTVPRCFATLKAILKAPEHILGPFKFFSHRIFDHQKSILLIGLTEPLKMPIYEDFQNLKAFSR